MNDEDEPWAAWVLKKHHVNGIANFFLVNLIHFHEPFQWLCSGCRPGHCGGTCLLGRVETHGGSHLAKRGPNPR